MKIRTDFVTNSSSSSFVAINIKSNLLEDFLKGNGIQLDFFDTLSQEIGEAFQCTPVTFQGKFYRLSEALLRYIDFACALNYQAPQNCEGLTFSTAGKFKKFYDKDSLFDTIETYGGTASGSVSKKTNYLICNDPAAKSTAVDKAKELSIPIISEDKFIEMFDINVDQEEELDNPPHPTVIFCKIGNTSAEEVKKLYEFIGQNAEEIDRDPTLFAEVESLAIARDDGGAGWYFGLHTDEGKQFSSVIDLYEDVFDELYENGEDDKADEMIDKISFGDVDFKEIARECGKYKEV